MVPVLLVIDSLIWYGLIKSYRYDRATGPYPENPQFDLDLDNLWEQGTKPFQPIILPKLKREDDDKLLKKDFEAWVERERNRDKTLEDYLWEEGIVNPQEVVWCDGTPLVACDSEDLITFERILNKAYLEGVYNSKLLEDGGYHDLYKAWLMMKGCSDYGAEQLLEMGVMPWQFDLEG